MNAGPMQSADIPMFTDLSGRTRKFMRETGIPANGQTAVLRNPFVIPFRGQREICR